MNEWSKFAPTNNKVPGNCQICLVNIRDKNRDQRLFPQAAIWYNNKWWVRFCSGGVFEQIRVFYPPKVVQDSMLDTKAYRCYHCNLMNTESFEVVSYAPFDRVSVEELDGGMDQMGLFEEFKEGGGVV